MNGLGSKARPEPSLADATPRRQRRRTADRTRAMIIETTGRMLADASYFSLTVDDIARQAGISRSSFYLHFQGKDEVLVALARIYSPGLERLYDWFSGKVASRATVLQFIKVYSRFSRRARPYYESMQIAATYNDQLEIIFLERRQRYIYILGKSLRAFRDLRVGSSQYSHAMLILFQIETVGNLEVYISGRDLRSSLYEALADNIIGFLFSTDGDEP